MASNTNDHHNEGDNSNNATSQYVLPSHEDEVKRLQRQHILFGRTFGGQRYFSPLGSPKKILDLGTGTGAWAIEMANEFPQAMITGVDLGMPIVSDDTQPLNFRSVTANFEDDWQDFHDQEPFDYIHGRLIVMSIRNHRRLIQQARQNLRPGGWLEIQDIEIGPDAIREENAPSHPGENGDHVMEWLKLENEGFANFGIHETALLQWPSWLTEAGFVNQDHRIYKWPLGTWPEDDDLKSLGKLALENMLDGVEGWSMIVFTKGLGWSKHKVRDFLQNVRKDLVETRRHYYLTVHVICAQKPVES